MWLVNKYCKHMSKAYLFLYFFGSELELGLQVLLNSKPLTYIFRGHIIISKLQQTRTWAPHNALHWIGANWRLCDQKWQRTGKNFVIEIHYNIWKKSGDQNHVSTSANQQAAAHLIWALWVHVIYLFTKCVKKSCHLPDWYQSVSSCVTDLTMYKTISKMFLD